ATVSHELRTPLNAFINLPEGLLDRFAQVRVASCESCHSRWELEEKETLQPDTLCSRCHASGSLKETADWRFRGDQSLLVDSLDRISRAGRSMLLLINDVLDFSKLQAGQVQLHVADVLVRPLILEVLEMLEPVAQKADVALRFDAPPPDAAAGELRL